MSAVIVVSALSGVACGVLLFASLHRALMREVVDVIVLVRRNLLNAIERGDMDAVSKSEEALMRVEMRLRGRGGGTSDREST